jgi:hypothetical protein
MDAWTGTTSSYILEWIIHPRQCIIYNISSPPTRWHHQGSASGQRAHMPASATSRRVRCAATVRPNATTSARRAAFAKAPTSPASTRTRAPTFPSITYLTTVRTASPSHNTNTRHPVTMLPACASLTVSIVWASTLTPALTSWCLTEQAHLESTCHPHLCLKRC